MRFSSYRRNFLALLGDWVSFGLALTFANATTTMPNFVAHLTASQVVVGLFGAVNSGAWLLPQLIFARFLTSKRRKKPYLLLGATIGRPFFLFYAAALWLGLHRRPGLALLLFFTVQVIFLASDALASVAWFDLYAKAIPQNRRGRLGGIAQSLRGTLAIGAGWLIAFLLGDRGLPFPRNYAIIFFLAGGWLLVSLASMCLIVEPDEPVQEERPTWRDYLPRLLGTLRQDRAFRRLIAVRLLAGFDSLALGFYILFATRQMGLPQEAVGLFTVVQTVAGIAGSLTLGAVCERLGSRRVIQFSTALGLTPPLAGLGLFLSGAQGGLLPTVVCAWIFLAVGIVQNAVMLGYFNYALELAPAGQRPTYMGLFNTLCGALVMLPPAGGWLLQATSYAVLFSVTAGVLAAAHGLAWRLPAPRDGE